MTWKMALTDPALLALRDVACVRGGRLLFEGIALVLNRGEAAVVVGPNGAGKSSLLRMAAGLLRPATGAVEHASVALADEAPALDRRLPLGAALRFWARLDGTDADVGIKAMGLGELAEIPVHMLSAGQRRRAGIARAISSRARLWLLDEPTNGLDAASCARLDAAIAAHREGGGAVLAASHQTLAMDGAITIRLGL